jgi:hypothetical protein
VRDEAKRAPPPAEMKRITRSDLHGTRTHQRASYAYILYPHRSRASAAADDNEEEEGAMESDASAEQKGQWVGRRLPRRFGDSAGRVYYSAIQLPWVEGPIKLHDHVLMATSEGPI